MRKGKRYGCLDELKAERPRGFAVVEHPTFWGEGGEYWHRTRSGAERRLHALWHRKVAARVVPLSELTVPGARNA